MNTAKPEAEFQIKLIRGFRPAQSPYLLICYRSFTRILWVCIASTRPPPTSCFQARISRPSAYKGGSFGHLTSLLHSPIHLERETSWQCAHFIPDSKTSLVPNVRNLKAAELRWDRAVQVVPRTAAVRRDLSPPTLKPDKLGIQSRQPLLRRAVGQPRKPPVCCSAYEEPAFS